MPFIALYCCPCCQKMVKTGDPWHCQDCWDRYHNGERDMDWLNREEYDRKHAIKKQEKKDDAGFKEVESTSS